MSTPTEVTIPARRIGAWLDGFVRRNGEIASATRTGTSVTLVTERGGSAQFALRLPGYPPAEHTVDAHLTALADWALARRRFAVVLVRRGGYTVGDVQQEAGNAKAVLLASKTGTRYVQGRTAAGGQSQQRFARRRANQADALVGAARDTAFGVLGGRPRPFDALVVGGDQELIDQVLADPRLTWLRALPARMVEVGDPRQRTIDEAVQKATALGVLVTNAD